MKDNFFEDVYKEFIKHRQTEFAIIYNNVSFIEDDTIPTIAVGLGKTGVNCYYSLKFFDGMTLETKHAILIHEFLHIALKHIQAQRNKYFDDKELANVAMDIVINEIIEADYKMKLPKDGCFKRNLCPDYNDIFTSEFVYDYLQQNGQDQGEVTNHDRWNDNQNSPIASEMLDAIGEKLIQAILAGKTTGNFSKRLEAEILKPKKDNRLNGFLRDFKSKVKMNKISTWMKPNFIGTPDTKGKLKDGTDYTVILDTSGSMQNEFQKLLPRLIKPNACFRLIMIDTEIQADFMVSKKSDFKKMLDIKGLGGTVLQTAIDKADKNKPCLLLTDGYVESVDFTGFKQAWCLYTQVEPRNKGLKRMLKCD
jgi:predicted metal-dependent peptidase